MPLTTSETYLLETAIGEKIAALLFLRPNKKTGYIQTSWGNKTMQGLGASVLNIILNETEQITATKPIE